MRIQDYLHLYIGCEVTTPDLITRKLIGVEGDAAITYGKYGRCVYSTKDTKPILRPLSDMTVEEAVNIGILPKREWHEDTPAEQIKWLCNNWQMPIYNPKDFTYLLSKGFDLFGLIDAGLAIPRLLNS